MKKMFLIVALCGMIAPVFAQMEQEDIAREKTLREKAAQVKADTSLGWHHNVVAGLNLTQVSFKDWAAGGENTLSYTLWLKGASIGDEEKTNWSNAYKLSFGQTRLGSQGLRKTDDEIYFESILLYKIGVHINPYAAFTARTQFAPGYVYADDGTRVQVSKFFDPGYLTQSIGASYKPTAEITTRLGAAVREIITSDYNGYSDDPETAEIEKVKVLGGLESVTEVDWAFAENMKFTSRLELFAPFKTIDEIIVRSDNAITAQVNKYITVVLSAQLINEREVTPRTQIKQTLAIGLSYALI
ncbi:MAG: DUF3078 domain-containing protein [Bacteroidota bacterium]